MQYTKEFKYFASHLSRGDLTALGYAKSRLNMKTNYFGNPDITLHIAGEFEKIYAKVSLIGMFKALTIANPWSAESSFNVIDNLFDKLEDGLKNIGEYTRNRWEGFCKASD